MELLRPVAFKKIVIGERLQTCRLTYRQTTALKRIVMNEVVPILGYVTGDSR